MKKAEYIGSRYTTCPKCGGEYGMYMGQMKTINWGSNDDSPERPTYYCPKCDNLFELDEEDASS